MPFDTSESTRNRRMIEEAEPISLIQARQQFEAVRHAAGEIANLGNAMAPDLIMRALAEVARLRDNQERQLGFVTPTLLFTPKEDPFAL